MESNTDMLDRERRQRLEGMIDGLRNDLVKTNTKDESTRLEAVERLARWVEELWGKNDR